MSTTIDEKTEILVKARAHRADLANKELSERAQRREDQIRRVKNRLRKFILAHGIEIKEAGRALGYEAVARLPRHLGSGKPDIEDLLAMMEFFDDFDPTTILRDVVLGVDVRPDEATARREKKISPDGERVAAAAKTPQENEGAPEKEEAEEPPFEEVVVVPDDATAPQEEEDPSLDTDEGLKVWANRFGFSVGA